IITFIVERFNCSLLFSRTRIIPTQRDDWSIMLFVSEATFLMLIIFADRGVAINEQKSLGNFNDRPQQNNGKLFTNEMENLSTFNALQKYQLKRNFEGNNRKFKKRIKKIQIMRMNFKENDDLINNEESLKILNIKDGITAKNRFNGNEFKNSSELMREQLNERMLNEREKENNNEKEMNAETVGKLLEDGEKIPAPTTANLIEKNSNNEIIKNYFASTDDQVENNDYEEYRYESNNGRASNYIDEIDRNTEDENYITKEEFYNTEIKKQLYKNNHENEESKKGNKRVVDQRNAKPPIYTNGLKMIKRKNRTTSIAPVIVVFLVTLTIFIMLIGLLTFVFIRNRRRNETIAANNATMFGDEVDEWAPDHINATQFGYKGPVQIPFKQPLIMEHELENEKVASIHKENHVAFDDALNEVYEIRSGVEKVIPIKSKNMMITSYEDRQNDMKNKISNIKKESRRVRKEIKGKKMAMKKEGSMRK
uniref:Uncharacterized protein n=1 Tax=Parascaris univalens TaxID=6257 RepID=A0A915B706_PARUN